MFAMLERNGTRLAQSLGGAWSVALFYFVYGLVHGGISRLAGPALALDDVKINVVAQSLEPGYHPDNPPLFEWLIFLVQSITGPTLVSFLVVKYALLVGVGVFTFLGMRLVVRDERWAGLGAISLLLLFQIGWNFHQAFTHSTALICALAFFWYALFRVIRQPTILTSIVLGLAAGLGLLSKYSFAFAIVCAVIGLGVTYRHRVRWLSAFKLSLVAVAVSSILVLPHAIWRIGETSAQLQSRFMDADASYWMKIASGLPETLWALVAFFLPIIPVLFLLFGIRWLMPGSGRPVASVGSELATLARNSALAGAVVLFAMVIFLGLDGMQERYAIAFLFPVIFWLIVKVGDGVGRIGTRKLLMANGAVLSAIVAVRLAQVLWPGEPFCSDCRQWIPYEGLGRAVQEAGWEEATLVGFEDHTAGNLRRLFPKARVLSAHIQYYAPPTDDNDRPCIFVWSPQLGPPAPDHVTNAIDPSTSKKIEVPWQRTIRSRQGDEKRVTEWFLGSLDKNPSIARSVCRPN
ncbi:MAG: glycosyltransferase family 39 protein [Pseudomonadota bacterium]